MTLYFFYCIRNRYKPHPHQHCALQISMRYCWFSVCASHSFIASFQSVTSPLAMASASWRAWSRALSRARFAFISAMVCSSRITIAPTTYCIVQFLLSKGFAYSLKDKYELLSKAKKRSHANRKFAWLLLLFCMLISALSLFYLSFYRNKYQKPDLVRHRAKCREYFSVSSSA